METIDQQRLADEVAKLKEQVAELSARNARLVHASRQLQALLDNVPDRIYFKDLESRFIKLNGALARRLGVDDPEQVVGKTDFDFQLPERAREFYADEQRILQTGEALINKTEKQILPSGATAWTSTTKVPMRDAQGKITGLVGINRDITQQKQAEEELFQANQALVQAQTLLQAMLDNSLDWIYFKDTQSRILKMGRSLARAMGMADPEAAVGKTDFDFRLPEQAQEFYEDEQRMFRTGEALINKTEKQILANGETGWTSTTKVPMRNPEGKIVGLVGINRDITQQKQAEEALRQRDEKLRQFAAQLGRSNRELQDFAYVASHDLQEPLRKITVFGERLKERNNGNFDPESLDYMDRMQKATGRMQTLINDLLSFSRVTTKAQPFAPVNLAEVAAGVVEDLEGRIELVKGRVELGNLPVIDAEALQMRQLLQNLIGNALKFRRPEAPPVVKVEAQLIADPGAPEKQLCRLTVSDNCIGFEEKYVDRIFNVFQRLHTRNEYEGTGMGLAIVRKIALYHGGDITAKSKPGEGSTFILTIPVAHPQKPGDEITGAKPASA